jgi:hypothetical protein
MFSLSLQWHLPSCEGVLPDLFSLRRHSSMKLTSQHVVCIAVPTGKNAVSRVRKQFNSLVKKTEAARLRLAEWKESMPAIMAEAAREIQPLIATYAARQRDMVLLLDRMHRDKLMGKRERTKLSRRICSVALDLLADDNDPDIEAIYKRHSGDDGDALNEKAAFMELMEALGIDAGDVDGMDSPEALFAAFGAQPDDDDDDDDDDGGARAGPAARRKSAAALARERRQEAEAAKLKQTVRDIFRKLAGELHPDREPDPAERARKTALMQRVTVAYKAHDLLGLLELQLEIEQIAQADLNGLSEERVKQFNKILQGQLDEAEAEVAAFEHEAYMLCGGRISERRLTPQALLRRLRVDVAEMRSSIKRVEAELEAFRDANALKAWLKTYRPEPEPRYDDAFWF